MSFDVPRSQFPARLCGARHGAKMIKLCRTDESQVQRWRGETPCNRMQIQTESIDIEQQVVRLSRPCGCTSQARAAMSFGATCARNVHREAVAPLSIARPGQRPRQDHRRDAMLLGSIGEHAMLRKNAAVPDRASVSDMFRSLRHVCGEARMPLSFRII